MAAALDVRVVGAEGVALAQSVPFDEEVDRLRDRIQAWTGNAAQILALTPADVRRLRRAKEPIVGVWERELAVICGDRTALRGSR